MRMVEAEEGPKRYIPTATWRDGEREGRRKRSREGGVREGRERRKEKRREGERRGGEGRLCVCVSGGETVREEGRVRLRRTSTVRETGTITGG